MMFVVRHGRTEANARGLLLGRLDPALDDEGLRQAHAVAVALAAEAPGIERIVSSPLGRTRQTAEAIASELGGLEVETDDRWIELDYGELDGVPLRDVPAELWASWRSDVDFVPGGGESLRMLGTRVRSAADELAADLGAADAVVVSHVSPIKAAVAWALGVGDEVTWRMYLAPASITRIDCRGAVPSLHGYNDLHPLQGD